MIPVRYFRCFGRLDGPSPRWMDRRRTGLELSSTPDVRKTTMSIDDEKIARARAILGTHGITDTIEAALREIIRRDAVDRHIERLTTMDGLELDDPDVMARAWR